ncbi:jg16157 [Pararge aegeria aegeria]|uniref:Jg16157 protein n=1 Tax=Pararge aegeria aegeria TaxID=348720 RepID=A0A8S4REL1_9NEOP|nr:jg16157 [Pararge aegeria aegeria]
MFDFRSELLDNAWYSPGEMFRGGSKSFELLVNSTSSVSDAAILFEWKLGGFSIVYSAEYGYISVNRGDEDGERRAYWSPDEHIYLRIFVDYSSIEIFCGDGEVVFSSRIYPKTIKIRIGGSTKLHITQI